MEKRELHVGTHIGKAKTLLNSLKIFYDNPGIMQFGPERFQVPIQIFSGNPKGFTRPVVLEKERNATKEYIEKNGIQMFFHAPYIINLARPFNQITSAMNALRYDLVLGAAVGCKGVVVHCGKYLKMDPKEALHHMKDNIIEMLPYTDESCPLLIETPAGQGSELLCDIDDFINFYNSFDEEQKKKIGVCVDSCHVFSCGYDPYKYLKKLKRTGGIRVNLLHYNDSKEPLNSRKDRHAPIGTGHIPLEQLKRCESRCLKKGIPIVTEY